MASGRSQPQTQSFVTSPRDAGSEPMALWWLERETDGEHLYFIGDAEHYVGALFGSAAAGFVGGKLAVLYLSKKMARKMPATMIGRILARREAEALAKQLDGT